MKTLKGALAAALSLLFVCSLAGCHQKGEIAITSGDYTVTSAAYAYQLVLADSEAKNLIDTSEEYDTSAKGFSYYKQTIDGKKYSDYVKDEALNKALSNIAYEKLCKDAGLELDDETLANAENQALYYWNYYGYSALFEKNGVGYETYVDCMKKSYYADLYFKHLYGKDGEKAVSTDELQKAMEENYAAVYLLDASYDTTSENEADDKTAQLETYKTRLEAGESFADIYVEFKGSAPEAPAADQPAPADIYMSVVGSADTGVAFDYFDEVAALEQDAVAIYHDAETGKLYLVVKKDINSDSYYRDEYLFNDLLYLLKQDEFKAYINQYIEGLDYSVSKYAIGQFKVKKIDDGTNA